MSDQPTAPQQVGIPNIDPNHMVDSLRTRLADIVGAHAADAMVDAARYEAMVRALAAQNALQAAQLTEARNKTADVPEPAPPAAAPGRGA